MLALVVEDEIAISALYERVLQQVGYEVLIARDGEQAIHALNAHTPDLMLLDIRLPMVNGIDVLNFMAEVPRLQGTHVVIVTASREFEQFTSSVPSAEFLLKPITPQQIKDIAKRLLTD